MSGLMVVVNGHGIRGGRSDAQTQYIHLPHTCTYMHTHTHATEIKGSQSNTYPTVCCLLQVFTLFPSISMKNANCISQLPPNPPMQCQPDLESWYSPIFTITKDEAHKAHWFSETNIYCPPTSSLNVLNLGSSRPCSPWTSQTSKNLTKSQVWTMMSTSSHDPRTRAGVNTT